MIVVARLDRATQHAAAAAKAATFPEYWMPRLRGA